MTTKCKHETLKVETTCERLDSHGAAIAWDMRVMCTTCGKTLPAVKSAVKDGRAMFMTFTTDHLDTQEMLQLLKEAVHSALSAPEPDTSTPTPTIPEMSHEHFGPNTSHTACPSCSKVYTKAPNFAHGEVALVQCLSCGTMSKWSKDGITAATKEELDAIVPLLENGPTRAGPLH